MSRIIVESTNSNDSAADIEEKLEKAVSAIKQQRERRQFTDLYLKGEKDKADKVVNSVLDSMVDEIAKVLS